MSVQEHYYKLGLFIIVGVLVLLAGLIILGLDKLRKDKLMMETYFVESVQGLDIGSAVKFKGVKIGSVERIRFAFRKYQDSAASDTRYVVVEMGIDPDSALGPYPKSQFKEAIAKEVERGLRIKIAPQGVTGTAYLELDYFGTKGQAAALPVDWEPEHAYVPSAPSTYARLEETFETFSTVMRKVERAGLDRAISNANELLIAMKKAVGDADIDALSTQLASLLRELRGTNDEISKLLASKDAKATVKDFAATMANLRKASEELPAAIERAQRMMRDMGELTHTQRGEIEAIIQNARQALENIRDLTGQAKRDPASLFLNPPPAPVDPAKTGSKKAR